MAYQDHPKQYRREDNPEKYRSNGNLTHVAWKGIPKNVAVMVVKKMTHEVKLHFEENNSLIFD